MSADVETITDTSVSERLFRLLFIQADLIDRLVHEKHVFPMHGFDFDASVAEYERMVYTAYIDACAGQATAAAKLLKLSRPTFYGRLYRLGILKKGKR